MRAPVAFSVAAVSLLVAASVGSVHADGAGAPAATSKLPALLPASRGKTFFVSTRGRDSNQGTRGRPWRTIGTALRRLRPGQRALARRGTYAEDLSFGRAGRPTAPITVAAYPGERVVLRPASTSGDTYPIRISGSYFRLRGFVIQGARGTSSTNVYFEDGADHAEISANDIRYSQDQGVFADPGTRNLFILGNRIHDNGRGHVSGQHQSHGIYIEGRDHLIANNLVRDHPFGFGIQIYPENTGTIAVNNTVVRSGHSGIVVGGDEGVGNIVLRNNILAYNDDYGVAMDSDCPVGPVLVDTNVIHGNGEGAIEGGCSKVQTSGGNQSGNPLFVSARANNFQVGARSPAVDRALADYAPRTDLRGHRRPAGAGYDIGAFERSR